MGLGKHESSQHQWEIAFMLTLIFDTETTGLVQNSGQSLAKQPQVLEFFGLVIDGEDKEVATLHKYFNPGRPIAPLITKITGITDDMVKAAPSFVDGCEGILKLIASVEKVVAHNLSYDISVIDFEFDRMEKKVEWPKKKICTVEATENFLGYRLNLGALHEHLFGDGFTGAHKAENDVRATARCYIELVRRGEV